VLNLAETTLQQRIKESGLSAFIEIKINQKTIYSAIQSQQ